MLVGQRDAAVLQRSETDVLIDLRHLIIVWIRNAVSPYKSVDHSASRVRMVPEIASVCPVFVFMEQEVAARILAVGQS